MKILIRDTTLVRPVEATPNGVLWIANIDQVKQRYPTPSMYIYPNLNGVANFFDTEVLKAALGRALVAFYPAAGRLNINEEGRYEINCNGEGVLFVEAESDGTLDDLGDFMPKPDIDLCPIFDYSKGISTQPLAMFQVTRFKCGGVCLGVKNDHRVSDGIGALHFINTWADIACGHHDNTIRPIIDRSLLKARSPPQPQFDHIEYCRDIIPTMNDVPPNGLSERTRSTFEITRDHLNTLKSICNDNQTDVSYSSYEVLAGHIWRCACKARGLAEDQKTRLQLLIEGRTRLIEPVIPQEYYGNVVFPNMCIASAGEIQSKPLKHVVSIIHDAIMKMTNDYIRSSIDFLEMQHDLPSLATKDDDIKCPNLQINSWVRLPFKDADFGWGKPIFFCQGTVPSEGKVLMLPSPINDGSLLLSVTLQKEHMKLFEEILYEKLN